MKTLFKKWLFGISESQEFLCLAKEELSDPLKVFLQQSATDISEEHLFLGYKPLIIATFQSEDEQRQSIFFENSSNGKRVAVIKLKKEITRKLENGLLDFFVATYGSHSLLSGFHQFMLDLHNFLLKRKKGNVFLLGNLLRQVSIAYSVPRTISIVSLGHNEQFNVFPSDLNGAAGKQYYVLSLRNNGKACEQLTQLGKCCVSTVPVDSYKFAYSMGKNHMLSLQPIDAFHGCNNKSEMLQLPLPEKILAYRELEVKEYFDIGIHRLFICSVLNFKDAGGDKKTLSHIHRNYLEWRKANGLLTNYFIR